MYRLETYRIDEGRVQSTKYRFDRCPSWGDVFLELGFHSLFFTLLFAVFSFCGTLHHREDAGADSDRSTRKTREILRPGLVRTQQTGRRRGKKIASLEAWRHKMAFNGLFFWISIWGKDPIWQYDSNLSTRWWFQTFFIFTPIWGRFPFWLIFFRWVETTNQSIIVFKRVTQPQRET